MLRICLTCLMAFQTILLSAQNKHLDSVFNYFHDHKNFSGVILMGKAGKIEYIMGKGVANRELASPISTKSVFKIASITKTFTAVLIMQLVEKGQLSLEDPIGKFYPEYNPETKDKVTIGHLLTYSSGIADCESIGGFGIYQQPVSTDSFIARFCSSPFSTKPGSTFLYENGGYIILGRILEKITGHRFEKILKDNILDPLEMKSTGIVSNRQIIPGLVSSYIYVDSLREFQQEPPYYLENYFSAAAMYSTAEDLFKFNNALFDCKLLGKTTVEKMLSPNPSLNNVGIGFWASGKYGGLESDFVYRPGGIFGSTSNWIHLLGSGRSIIILSNNNATNQFELSTFLNQVGNGEPASNFIR